MTPNEQVCEKVYLIKSFSHNIPCTHTHSRTRFIVAVSWFRPNVNRPVCTYAISLYLKCFPQALYRQNEFLIAHNPIVSCIDCISDSIEFICVIWFRIKFQLNFLWNWQYGWALWWIYCDFQIYIIGFIISLRSMRVWFWSFFFSTLLWCEGSLGVILIDWTGRTPQQHFAQLTNKKISRWYQRFSFFDR